LSHLLLKKSYSVENVLIAFVQYVEIIEYLHQPYKLRHFLYDFVKNQRSIVLKLSYQECVFANHQLLTVHESLELNRIYHINRRDQPILDYPQTPVKISLSV